MGAERGAPDHAAVLGAGVAAVLTSVFADGPWVWFSTLVGVTLIALIVGFYRLPRKEPGRAGRYWRDLAALSLVTGFCAMIAIAPAIQSAWIPHPDFAECTPLARYAAASVDAPFGMVSAADARQVRTHAYDDALEACKADTTTQWLPVYGIALAAAVFAGTAAWPRLEGRRARDLQGGSTE